MTNGESGAGALRVALVLGTSTGGIGRHVLSLTRGLTRSGVAVTVFCPAATEAQFQFAAAGGRVVPLEIPASLDTRNLRAVNELCRSLRPAESVGAPGSSRVTLLGAGHQQGHPAGHEAGPTDAAGRAGPTDAVGRDQVDIVHAHGLRAGLVAALARPAGVPLVVTWHNTVLGGGLRATALRAGERYVARSADVTLGASEDLVARVRSLGGRDVRLGAVAAPPLPPLTRPPAEVRLELDADHRPLVLSVGRLHPQKGYDVLVSAAARWRMLDPAPVVAIAGTGPAYRNLAARILASRAPVTLLGQRDDVADLLAAADLAIVSSVWEARQLFAQEALAAGVPLVATEVGGLPGLVGDAARLIPPNDVDALDVAVRELLVDPELRARYVAAGRARAATWPTEADTVAQVGSVYAELTGRPDLTTVRP